MKKKVISMLLVSAMAVTLIAGCGNNGADERSPKETEDAGGVGRSAGRRHGEQLEAAS